VLPSCIQGGEHSQEEEGGNGASPLVAKDARVGGGKANGVCVCMCMCVCVCGYLYVCVCVCVCVYVCV